MNEKMNNENSKKEKIKKIIGALEKIQDDEILDSIYYVITTYISKK